MNNSVYHKIINARFNNAKNMLHVKMNVWNKKEAKELFQELPFYNTFIEMPRIKRLKNRFTAWTSILW